MLKYLQSKGSLLPKLTRWALAVQDCDLEVVHRKDKDNGNVARANPPRAASRPRAEGDSATPPAERRGRWLLPTRGFPIPRRAFLHPRNPRTAAMGLCHEAIQAGHPGMWKMEKRVTTRFSIGEQPRAQVRRYIRTCDVCQKRKLDPRKIGTLQPVSPPDRP